MDNQEAIKILGQYDVSDLHFYTTDGEEIPFTEWSDAIEMAISALQAQEETVSRKVYEQISWERDIAVMQLKDLGYGLGEKIRTDGGTISRQVAIDAVNMYYDEFHEGDPASVEDVLKALPSAQPEPLSDAYMNAVWTWLLDYQIKVAELKGRYTPYEVLSWVANDWRKEHEGADKQTRDA